ncbi:histidine phosphatase family protein [Rhizobium puerariae]|uniref:Histidine phosphatase family protein n=1 Tax=Rhizobium puerariae TaxID=1585791 RepID=A0ABV6AIS2_9HYPH
MSAKPKKKDRAGRRLILLRHAKSAWPEGVADEERPLAPRGRKAAPLMGDYMARERLVPDLGLVSPARRTQETWALVRDKLPGRVDVRDHAGLYEASGAQILDVLAEVEAACRNLLIIGHNPGLQELALLLSDTGNADTRQKIAEKYPTAGLVVIDFDTADWQGVGEGSGRLERFVTPRSLE